jgi:hypothetical protein
MNIGFDTIGNATLICYDRVPVLATDPWLTGDPYFGSWTFSHEVPEELLSKINACKFLWISHGHPDHLSGKSLELLGRDKQILLPDHVGGRIRDALREDGYHVTVLKDYVWTTLSDHIRVLCISDVFQDAILLIDIGGRLVVNLNDAVDHGWGYFVKRVIRSYPVSFLLRLSGFGDADMMNLFREDGTAILPWAAQRYPVGKSIARTMNEFGARYFVPFSSMHKYQREDSVWAGQYTTTLADYPVGFDSKSGELLPAFVRYDCETDRVDQISPAERTLTIRKAEEFGDNWNDPLDASDKRKLTAYFKPIEHLSKVWNSIRFRCGGVEHIIDLDVNQPSRGITFEVPRNSLMIAIENEVFDDLLIANFMKVTLHGDIPDRGLHPDFTPYVGKFADNGRAKSEKELRRYFAAYHARAPLATVRYETFRWLSQQFQGLPKDSTVRRMAKHVYFRLTGS